MTDSRPLVGKRIAFLYARAESRDDHIKKVRDHGADIFLCTTSTAFIKALKTNPIDALFIGSETVLGRTPLELAKDIRYSSIAWIAQLNLDTRSIPIIAVQPGLSSDTHKVSTDLSGLYHVSSRITAHALAEALRAVIETHSGSLQTMLNKTSKPRRPQNFPS